MTQLVTWNWFDSIFLHGLASLAYKHTPHIFSSARQNEKFVLLSCSRFHSAHSFVSFSPMVIDEMQFSGVVQSVDRATHEKQRAGKKNDNIGNKFETFSSLFMAICAKLIWTWSNSLLYRRVINFKREFSIPLDYATACVLQFALTTVSVTYFISINSHCLFIYVSFTHRNFGLLIWVFGLVTFVRLLHTPRWE